MSITFENAVEKATRDGVTDWPRAWAIGCRVARLYLVCTSAVPAYQRERYAAWIDELMVPTAHWEFWERVDEVRTHVVEEQESGEICKTGSNQFLEWMGLEEIETARDYEVTVTVTLTFRVEGIEQDREYVENDVREYLRVNAHGNIDNADFNTVNVDIDSVDAEEL